MTGDVTLTPGAVWLTSRRVLTVAERREVLRWYDAECNRVAALEAEQVLDAPRQPDHALAERLREGLDA